MKEQVQKDFQKSQALQKMAEVSLQRLSELPIEKYPTNSLIDYYDVIHKLLDAYALEQGYKFFGEDAHKQLIDHCCEKLQVPDEQSVFLQSLRYFRNRIQYEGFTVKKEFIAQHKDKIEGIIDHLFRNFKSRLH